MPQTKASPEMNSPEKELLLACVRTRMPAELAEHVRAIVRGPLDWKLFLAAAENHCVLPLVWQQLETVCGDSVPTEWREKLRASAERTAQRNLQLAGELFRLAALFRAANITAIPYKGPVLAAQAYGSFALRQFADLDFAVRQRDLPHAAAELAREGYESAFGALATNEDSQTAHGDYKFVRARDRLIVELKTEGTLRHFPRALNFGAFQSRLKRVPLPGGEIETFSAEDTLIFLAVHGAKHFWERLLWITDISELAQMTPGIAWPQAFSIAEEMGVTRMLNLALDVATRMLQTPLPKEVQDRVRRDAGAMQVGRAIAEQFSLAGVTDLAVFSRFKFRMAMREGSWSGMQYAFRLATLPSEADREELPLPEKLSGMHRWLRPFLLMRRHGIKR
jgi:hypothetical protein